MANVLNKPRNKFTQISNDALNDIKLSCKAKGLLAFMLSKPDKWNFSMRGIATQVKEGETAVRNIIKELRQQSYLKVESIRNEKGRIDHWEYTLSHKRTDGKEHIVDYPDVENTHVDNSHVDGEHTSNTDSSNTDSSDTTNSPTIIKNNSRPIRNFSNSGEFNENNEQYNIPSHLKKSGLFMKRFNKWLTRNNPSIDEIEKNLTVLGNQKVATAAKMLQFQIEPTNDEKEIASILISTLKTIKKREPDSKDYDVAPVIARKIIKFHKDKAWGLPTQPGTPRFHFPTPEKLAEHYSKWLVKRFSGWNKFNIHVMKTSSRTWRDFIQETEQDYMVKKFKS